MIPENILQEIMNHIIAEQKFQDKHHGLYSEGAIAIYNLLTAIEMQVFKGSYQEALQRIKAEGGWIPVSEEFPEDKTDVLVCDSEGIDISSGFATESGTWLWFHSRRKFTHWHPLPLPPKL